MNTFSVSHCGLPPRDLGIIECLASFKFAPPYQIQATLPPCSKSVLHRALNRLTAKGVISQVARGRDGLTWWALTPAGRTLVRVSTLATTDYAEVDNDQCSETALRRVTDLADFVIAFRLQPGFETIRVVTDDPAFPHGLPHQQPDLTMESPPTTSRPSVRFAVFLDREREPVKMGLVERVSSCADSLAVARPFRTTGFVVLVRLAERRVALTALIHAAAIPLAIVPWPVAAGRAKLEALIALLSLAPSSVGRRTVPGSRGCESRLIDRRQP